jgi:hypothetical protein
MTRKHVSREEVLSQLNYLTRSNPKESRKIIRNGSGKLIKVLCNACLNAQRGNIHYSPYHRKLISPHSKFINDLTSKKLTLNQKRDRISKSKSGSGFLAILPHLIGPVVSTIGSFLVDKLFKKSE